MQTLFFFPFFFLTIQWLQKLGKRYLNSSSPNKEEKVMPLTYNTFDNEGEY